MIIVPIFLGLISGFFTGFTGLSAIGIILGGLSMSNIITDYKTIVGTVLYLLMFPFTIASVWEYYKAGKINFLIGNTLLISVLVGSYLGTKIALNANLKISNKTVKYISAFVSFFVGTYFLSSAYYTKD
jgi:hypothetical protein